MVEHWSLKPVVTGSNPVTPSKFIKMAKREVVNVDVMDRGLFMIDHDPKECDFCDEEKVCASINCLCKDVMCICKDCLQKFVNAF